MEAGDLVADLSKHLVTDETIGLLMAVARRAGLEERIEAKFGGEHINVTEYRPVLHTALRAARGDSFSVDGVDIVDDVHAVLERMGRFAERVRSGEWTGFTGKRIRHVVNIGIGGSDLGPALAYRALRAHTHPTSTATSCRTSTGRQRRLGDHRSEWTFHMRSLRPSDIVLGAASGVIGMLAMDVLWWRRARRAGSEDGFVEWEFSTGTAFDSYASAGAPAQIGRRLARLGGVELPTERAGLVTDVVHWATGVGWGVASGVLVATTPVPALPAGVLGGVAAVALAYGALGAVGVYDPVWEYDVATLWHDVSAHLVFGATTGIALWALRTVRS